VTGSVGSGKTQLLRTLAERAMAGGATYLSATASRAARTLPLGVIGQLFEGAELSEQSKERVARYLDEGAFSAMLDGASGEVGQQIPARVLHGLCWALLELCERQPLVVGVDDVHHADLASRQYLAYLIRRLRSARALVVLNQTALPQPGPAEFQAELARQPHCRAVTLKLLSEHGVYGLLTQHLQATPARRYAAEYHAVSGGNPLLLNGLIADYKAAASTARQHLIVGPNFTHALVGCLHRADTSMLKVARGLAVLGEPTSPELLGQLLDLNGESTTAAVAALTATGVLHGGAFRHLNARQAVLDTLVPEERAALHARAARLLASSGVAATVVARHLLQAEGVDDAWAPLVLRQAAEQALAEADVDLAIACLRRAPQAATDATERAVSRAHLARAEWRINTSIAARHIPELRVAAYAGHLPGPDVVTLVNWMLWLGDVDDARDLLDRLRPTAGPLDAETTEALVSARLWLAALYPSAGYNNDACRGEPPEGASPSISPKVQAARLLGRVLRYGLTDESVAAAEQIVHDVPLDEDTLGPIGIALAALVYGDRLAMATRWCDPLIRQARSLRAPTWQAVFTVIRAEIGLRQGDLHAAEEYARDSLTLIAPKSWGVAIGIPLAVLTQASTARGRHEDAANHLEVPVPDRLMDTPVGLQYLRARGWHHYATGRYAAALDDFERCGEFMARWGLEFPAFVPWRSDAAYACLRLGRRAWARKLALDQLDRLGPGHVRTRGQTLRVLAAASPARRRPPLLRQAVEASQAAGDRLELAYALADLGKVHYVRGEFRRARTMRRRAHQLASECGIEVFKDASAAAAAQDKEEDSPRSDVRELLSDAERRVAGLAAHGSTNRQIADQLHVTVSTVEQHLTRVYRKLAVHRRADLPPGLHPGIASWD